MTDNLRAAAERLCEHRRDDGSYDYCIPVPGVPGKFWTACQDIATLVADRPADEPVDEGRLDSLEGSWNGDVWKSPQSPMGLHVEWGRNTKWLFIGSDALFGGAIACVKQGDVTMGDILRLCEALGVPLEETKP